MGQVVIGAGGSLVGRVVEVGPTIAHVVLISDPTSTVTGQLLSTSATGKVVGQLGGALVMTDVDSAAEVTRGEEVFTAGIELGGGLRSPYPKGLLIGRVIDVTIDPNEVVQTVFLEPAAPLDRLEFLLVITDYEGGILGPIETGVPCDPTDDGTLPELRPAVRDRRAQGDRGALILALRGGQPGVAHEHRVNATDYPSANRTPRSRAGTPDLLFIERGRGRHDAWRALIAHGVSARHASSRPARGRPCRDRRPRADPRPASPRLVRHDGGVDATIDAAAAAPKVVIVVGATHEATDSYRNYANQMYAEAIKYTPNVVKVYSPNATWKNVKAAAQGASILIYLGHGSGYPRDDSAVFNPDGHDGMGLNSPSNKSDYVAKYYGESYMANDIRLAKNAVVILSHLCFASGNSMSGDPEPTYSVAQQRIDNFASGFLRAGARTVIADVWNSGVIHYIRSIFTTDQTIGNMWSFSPSNHGHQMPFTPLRNPAYQAVMDPNNWTSGFYRSIVGAFDMRTTAVLAGASESVTSKHPSTFQLPGAAAVGDAPVSLYDDATLGEPSGAALPSGGAVRVTDLVPADDGVSDPALEVETLDGSSGGWVDGAGLIPRDSAGPKLWSMDGPDTISPNFDGYLDRLNLWARFSESVSLVGEDQGWRRRRRPLPGRHGAPGRDHLGCHARRRSRTGRRLHVAPQGE